jgi:hypothetical protein
MMNNITEKLSLIEQLKLELCERYGVELEQIQIELTVKGIEKEKGLEILKDHAFYTHSPYFNDETGRGHTHAKGGFDWIYVREPEKEGEEDELIIE